MSGSSQTMERSSRTLFPWLVVAAIAFAALVAMLGLAAFFAIRQGQQSRVPDGLAQATLADGSVLVLHDITDSSSPLMLPIPSDSLAIRLGFKEPPVEPFHAGVTSSDRLKLWFARYVGETGRPLEFDRWSHCVVRTAKGLAAYDGSYASRVTRQTHPHISTSSSSRLRPFAPDDPLGPERYSHIVYASGLPMLRSHGPHIELDIYDSDAGWIATMTVPFPGGHRRFPTLAPEPLPASRTVGDTEVVLHRIHSTWHRTQSETFAAARQDVHLELQVLEHGEESDEWSQRIITLSDAMENESYTYDCRLSQDEAAWNVDVRLFREDQSAAESAQRLVLESVELPDSDPATTPNTTRISGQLTAGPVTVKLLGVGGPGPALYQSATVRRGRGTHSSGHGIRAEYNPPVARLHVDREDRHVALQVVGLNQDYRLGVLITDHNGVQLPISHQHYLDEMQVFCFEADASVESLDVQVVLQQALHVQFTVAPAGEPPPVE